MKIRTFEDLEIWQLSSEIAFDIYKMTYNEKFRKDYGMCDQIRRAIISVSSNIVEGFERNNNNEFIHYLKIAKGSTGEVRSQLLISMKLNYLNEIDYIKIADSLRTLSSKIGKLIIYLSAKRINNEFTTR